MTFSKLITILALTFFLSSASFAEVQLYIPEQAKTVSKPDKDWQSWVRREKPHEYLCSDSRALQIGNSEVKDVKSEPRLISFQNYNDGSGLCLFFEDLLGKKTDFCFGHDKELTYDGTYALFYEPMRIDLFTRKYWGEIILSRKSGKYSIFAKKSRGKIFHIQGECKYQN